MDIKTALEAAFSKHQSQDSHAQAVAQNFDALGAEIGVNNSTQSPQKAQAYFEIGRQLGALSKAQYEFADSKFVVARDFKTKYGGNTLYFLGLVVPFNASQFNVLCKKVGLEARIHIPSADTSFRDGSPAIKVVFPAEVLSRHPPVDQSWRIYHVFQTPEMLSYAPPSIHIHEPLPAVLADGFAGALCDPSSLVFAPIGITPREGVLVGQKAIDEYVHNLMTSVEGEIGISKPE